MIYRLLSTLLTGTLTLLAASTGSAQGVIQQQKIVGITINTTNTLAFIAVSNPDLEQGKAACGHLPQFQFALQLGSTVSDSMFKLLLESRTRGMLMTLKGSGKCDPTSPVEVLEQIDF
jgi:hypothetical protein